MVVDPQDRQTLYSWSTSGRFINSESWCENNFKVERAFVGEVVVKVTPKRRRRHQAKRDNRGTLM
jgi:hypothetical protein